MSDTITKSEVQSGFGAKELKANAALYRKHKSIMDGASKYDSLDDAVSALTEVWEALESQAVEGQGYTPPVEFGFGSDNASTIAETLMGRRSTVGECRKNFRKLGE